MSNVKKEIKYSRITVDKVSDHKYRSDRKSAQIRQTVTKITEYKSKGDSLMTSKPRRFEEPKERVTWTDVELDDTVESVQRKLDGFEDATIYQIVSFDIMDCLSEGHIDQIKNPLSDLTLDKMKDKFTLKNKEKEPILKDGKIIYRSLYLKLDGKKDIINLSSTADVEEIEEIVEKATGTETDVA